MRNTVLTVAGRRPSFSSALPIYILRRIYRLVWTVFVCASSEAENAPMHLVKRSLVHTETWTVFFTDFFLLLSLPSFLYSSVESCIFILPSVGTRTSNLRADPAAGSTSGSRFRWTFPPNLKKHLNPLLIILGNHINALTTMCSKIGQG